MTKLYILTNFFIILIFLLLSTAPSSHSNNNQTDFEALLAFKKSIHDDPLGALSSWNETTHFCSWKGVSCGKRHPNRVVSLSLESQGLVGSLSPHIGNLSFLRTIILQNNSFRDSIPNEIGRLRRLQVIEFSNNSFGGGIPRNLSQCRNLYYLNLIDNELTGSIVPELASLVKLQVLALANNMLSGTILPFLGNLTNLIQLSLVECGLQGEIPESLVQLRRMRWLYMSGNSLTGTIPFGLFNLSNMEAFSLGFNQLHGTIPSFTLPNLQYLYLGPNHLTGPLPASLSNSSLIEKLYVSYNNFTGEMIDLTRLSSLETIIVTSNHLKGDIHTILSSLINSSRLHSLALDGNLFTGSLPDSIGNLSTHLSYLGIGRNQISGGIPSSIGNLIGLTYFVADDNNLQGPIPSTIGKLRNFQRIYLQYNRLTNEIPLSFGNLTLLNELGLWGNNLFGMIPQSLANCTNLLILDLSENNLFGMIPQSLANCTNLLILDLSENNLNGSIPPEILRLSSISIALALSHNLLTGTIPSEVGYLRNLGILDLSHNRLSGFIPTSLSSCIRLEGLDHGSNSLRGEIPDSLRSLRGLQHLDLSHNNFSGNIPTFLAEFPLLYLNLSFNALEGEVPTLGVFQNQSAISVQGNHHLCGGIPILNLPSCPPTISKKKSNLGRILIPTAGAICLALSLLCFCAIIYRRRTLQKAGTPMATFMVPEFLRLSYADLLNATSGFSESNLVGAGRFGSVYKGTIVSNDDEEENTVVAVKVLNLNIRGAYKSLASECNALRGIRHRNLLKIISVCDSIDFHDNDFKALVYEFMANGSLENWLHQNSEEQGRTLSIIQRVDIAIDIACGVEYLHGGTDSVVIHGDLKPSNILLDQDMVAHVGDFGLAKIISNISQNMSATEGSSSIAIKGTIGYIPPEYGMNDVVSTQGDAYSYGILVLEMFTNIRPTSDAFEGYVNLQDFVSSSLTDRVMEVVDPFLHQQLNEGDKYLDCIVSILRIGVRCSMELPRDRMSMAEVVNELKKIRTLFLAESRRGRNRNVAPYQH